MVNYIEVNGTHYDEDTPKGLIEALEQVRDTNDQVTIHYGDQMTGEDWESLYDPIGCVVRNTGELNNLLLKEYIKTEADGIRILTANIVKITFSNGKDNGTLWEHPNYHRPA